MLGVLPSYDILFGDSHVGIRTFVSKVWAWRGFLGGDEENFDISPRGDCGGCGGQNGMICFYDFLLWNTDMSYEIRYPVSGKASGMV